MVVLHEWIHIYRNCDTYFPLESTACNFHIYTYETHMQTHTNIFTHVHTQLALTDAPYITDPSQYNLGNVMTSFYRECHWLVISMGPLYAPITAAKITIRRPQYVIYVHVLRRGMCTGRLSWSKKWSCIDFVVMNQ